MAIIFQLYYPYVNKELIKLICLALHGTILSIVNKILHYLMLCNYEVKGLVPSNNHIINLGIIVMLIMQ